MQKAKNSEICNLWTFWPVIQLSHFKKMVYLQGYGPKRLEVADLAVCIASILKETSRYILSGGGICFAPPPNNYCPNAVKLFVAIQNLM